MCKCVHDVDVLSLGSLKITSIFIFLFFTRLQVEESIKSTGAASHMNNTGRVAREIIGFRLGSLLSRNVA